MKWCKKYENRRPCVIYAEGYTIDRMTTITLQKNINLPKTHFKDIEELWYFFIDQMPEKEVVRPEVLKRWAKAHADMDKGKGKSFTSAKAAIDYLRNL